MDVGAGWLAGSWWQAAAAAVSAAAAATAALVLATDAEVAPAEIVKAAAQREGDTLHAGPYELAQLSGGQTCYRRYGWKENPGAPVVVLIHGATIPSPVFAPVAEAGLREGFRVLTYDQYSRGYSDRLPAGTKHPGMELFSSQLLELLESLKLTTASGEKVVLLGLSFGGSILAHFASQHAETVSGVVVGCPWIQQLGPRLQGLERLFNLTSSFAPLWLHRKWRALCFRYLVRPALRRRVNALAADTAAVEAAGVDLARVGQLMLSQFDVYGTESDFLALFDRLPQLPGMHPGGDLLWECWERIASGTIPVELLYATDDEDVCAEDAKRLHGLLMVKRTMSLRNRDAHTNVYSTTGGHGFLLQPKHLEHTFERVGAILYGEAYASKLKLEGETAAPAVSGGAAGL